MFVGLGELIVEIEESFGEGLFELGVLFGEGLGGFFCFWIVG